MDIRKRILKKLLNFDVTKVSGWNKEKIQTLSLAFYELGYSCWAKSYKTPTDEMIDKEREDLIDKGFFALKKSVEINPEFPTPYSYIGLLYREKIKVDELNAKKYIELNKEYNEKFVKAYKKLRASAKYRKQQEKELDQ